VVVSGTLQADAAEIRKALITLVAPGDVAELRALGVPNGRYSNTWSGYYDDLEAMAVQAAHLSDQGAKGVYFTLNPVLAALLARSANKSRIAGKDHIVTHNFIPGLDTQPELSHS
jgi:hypothetical protein